MEDHLIALVHCYEQQLQLMAQELAQRHASPAILRKQQTLKTQEQELALAVIKTHLGKVGVTGPFLYFHLPTASGDWLIHVVADQEGQELKVDVQVFPCVSAKAMALPA